MSEPGTIGCPRCHAPVGPEQSWCLNCGAAARTRLAPTPNWRAPIAAVAVVVALAGVVLALAFVRVTGNNDTPSQTITTTSPAPTTATPPTTTAPPAAGSTAPTTTTAPPEATTTPPNQPVPTQTSPGG